MRPTLIELCVDLPANFLAGLCAAVAPTTLLTNGMLFQGTRLAALRRLPRSVVLQVSIDSPTSEVHDAHRGRGSWQRAIDGIAVARHEGFRTRIAATVADDEAASAMLRFCVDRDIPPEDRVIRRVVRRGFSTHGTPLARMDLVPELTITADGVYWHPVGAEDDDLLITRDILPLSRAFAAARAAAERETSAATRLASIFMCA